MLRHTPKLSYSGLTIVMSNPSRLDKYELISGNGGVFFNETCLRPQLNRFQCDIRLKEDRSSLLPNTKCVLLLGEPAMRDWLGNTDNSIGELRGSPFVINGIPNIASYLPQDCTDYKDWESEHNPLSENFKDNEDFERESDEDDDSPESEKRRHGFTKRKNFGFWLLKDLNKCKHILLNGLPKIDEPTYITYPALKDIVDILNTTKNEYLYLDIEVDSNLNITIFSFSFGHKVVYIIPCILPDYSHAYSNLCQIYRALAVAIRDNITVAHNGSNFDFFVLAYKYRIPINKVYDTLIASHRCFPEIEKSLGHFVSLFTYLKFHKDMGDVGYNNLENAKQIWQYCGLDVYSMALAHSNLLEYVKTKPGLSESIQLANDAIKPYLVASLTGIRYRQDILDSTLSYNDRIMNQYLRMLDILIGKENLKIIRGKGKSSMPSSNLQCVRYFHDLLGYATVGKGKERVDGTKGPSLGKKNLYKLRLKYPNNPTIDICLLYRETMKESGSLRFTPFKL